jgi:hypothetical protein
LVPKRGGWFAPPTKKSQPWSPDIDHSPHRRDRPILVLPLMGNPQKLVHADALMGKRIEMPRYPQELVVLEFKDCRTRAVFGTVAEIAVPLIGEWCVSTLPIPGMTGTKHLIHGEPPIE